MINKIIANISIYIDEYNAISLFNGKLTVKIKEHDPLMWSYNMQHIIHEINILLGDNFVTRLVVRHDIA